MAQAMAAYHQAPARGRHDEEERCRNEDRSRPARRRPGRGRRDARLRPRPEPAPLRRAQGHRSTPTGQDVAAAGPADPAVAPEDLHHVAGAVLRRARPPGADPQPAEQRHRQLRSQHHTRAPPLLRVVDRRPGRGRRWCRVHLAAVPVQDGLRHRVRPAEHHLRAPDQDVVPLLRPGPVGAADLAGPTPTSARCRCT